MSRLNERVVLSRTNNSIPAIFLQGNVSGSIWATSALVIRDNPNEAFNTKLAIAKIWGRLMRFMNERHREPHSLCRTDLREFFKWTSDRYASLHPSQPVRSKQTIYAERYFLWTICEELVLVGWLPENPTGFITRPDENGIVRPIFKAGGRPAKQIRLPNTRQMQDVIFALESPWQDIAYVLLGCGARWAEFAQVINGAWQKRRLTSINTAGEQTWEVPVTRKGGRRGSLWIPGSDAARWDDLYGAIRQNSGFITRDGFNYQIEKACLQTRLLKATVLTPQDLRDLSVEEQLEKTGLKITVHDLRHFFATAYWEAGMRGDKAALLQNLQALLGHSSPLSTLGYIHRLGFELDPHILPPRWVHRKEAA